MNILITQIVSHSIKRGYVLSLSKDWIDYSEKIGLNLIPYNYNFSKTKLNKIKIDGLILSGGNDLSKIKKNKENFFRDKEEKKIFKYCLDRNVPILGVCRGFQLIASHFKFNLKKCKGHVRTRHKLNLNQSKYTNSKNLIVNSFHNYCLRKISNKFDIISYHSDKSIEIAELKEKKILCLMFHPERLNISQKEVDKYIINFFRKK